MHKALLLLLALSLLASTAAFAEEGEVDFLLLEKKWEQMWKATEGVPEVDSLGKDTSEVLLDELRNQPSKSHGAISLAGYKAAEVAMAEIKRRNIDLNVFQQMHMNETERFYAASFSMLPLFSTVQDGGGVTVVMSKPDFGVKYVFRSKR
jgi:hypothetical protein